MASRDRMQLISCFALSAAIFIVILAISSNQAAATSSISSTSKSNISEISELRRSMLSLKWNPFPKDWFKKTLKILNKLRHRILDEMLKIMGLPPTGDIWYYFWKAVSWLLDKLFFFLSDPRARIDTAIEWIVDSAMNPFRTLTDGMLSFRRLFRYLHQLKKRTSLDFGSTNPVYHCFSGVFPDCVKGHPGDSVARIVAVYFWCGWAFYEKCQLRFWWENGMWNVPMINGGDPCKVLPKKKCADQPPI